MPGPDSEIPDHEIAATAGAGGGRLRVSHADREQVVGTLKTAFVQGRLAEDELDARVDRVYASRTYAELADVSADIPAELTETKAPRDPWRATKIAFRVEYAIFLPAFVAFLLVPGGPRTTAAEMVALTSVVCLLFWLLGVFMVVAARPAKRSGGQRPPRAVPGAAAGSEPLHVSHAVAREQVSRILTAAWAQGRLTEDERDARAARVSASRCQADLAVLIADLPAGLAARPPTTRDVRTGGDRDTEALAETLDRLVRPVHGGLGRIAVGGRQQGDGDVQPRLRRAEGRVEQDSERAGALPSPWQQRLVVLVALVVDPEGRAGRRGRRLSGVDGGGSAGFSPWRMM
jgi:hypothetical protein